jgi:hypothetical protein
MMKSFFSIAAVGFVLSSTAFAYPAASTAKLYTSFDAKPSPDCDIYTLLTLTKMDESAVYVKFEEKVDGFCDVYRNPNVRVGLALLKDEPCGSKSLKGSLFSFTSEKLNTFEILDHRTRLCDDKLGNSVEVKISNDFGYVGDLLGFFAIESNK